MRTCKTYPTLTRLLVLTLLSVGVANSVSAATIYRQYIEGVRAPAVTAPLPGTGLSGSCSLPWGGVTENNTDVIAYQASSVLQGSTCSSHLRHCSNGVLSNSYTYQTCDVADPSWGNVVLMLNGDGGSIVDASPSNQVLSNIGSPTIDTAVKAFGAGSIKFNGSSSVNITDSQSLDVGSSDFTVEAWVRPRSLSGRQALMSKRISTMDNTPFFIYYDGSRLIGRWTNSGGAAKVITFTSSAVVNEWAHIVLQKSGSTLTAYYNGTATDNDTSASGSAYVTTAAISIGADSQGSAQRFNGNIDDYRFTVEEARYPENFLVPSSAMPTR